MNKKAETVEPLKAHAERAGLDLESIKTGARRILPIIKPIAKLTPNQYDDAFVAFVESLLAADAQ